MDRVATQVLGLFGDGEWAIFADYWQWKEAQRQRAAQDKAGAFGQKAAMVSGAPERPVPPDDAAPRRGQKLSYMEQREWEGMESRIHDAESRLAEIETQLSDPAVVADGTRVAELLEMQAAHQAEVESLYARWGELEEKQSPQLAG
jgi:ABC transport system ATP-binding/permease protein